MACLQEPSSSSSAAAAAGASSAAGGRQKIDKMSGEVVDSNPYSRLMALQRMGIVKDYEQIRNKTVRRGWRHLCLHLHCSTAVWQWIGAATQEVCLLPPALPHTHCRYMAVGATFWVQLPAASCTGFAFPLTYPCVCSPPAVYGGAAGGSGGCGRRGQCSC